MNNEPLAPIFLDNKPVVLKDPKPRISSVLSAGGSPGVTEVKWLQTQTGTQGTFLRLDHTLDRTSEPTKAIYLSSQARASAAPATVPIVDEDVEAPKSLLPWPAGGNATNTPGATTPATATNATVTTPVKAPSAAVTPQGDMPRASTPATPARTATAEVADDTDDDASPTSGQ